MIILLTVGIVPGALRVTTNPYLGTTRSDCFQLTVKEMEVQSMATLLRKANFYLLVGYGVCTFSHFPPFLHPYPELGFKRDCSGMGKTGAG